MGETSPFLAKNSEKFSVVYDKNPFGLGEIRPPFGEKVRIFFMIKLILEQVRPPSEFFRKKNFIKKQTKWQREASLRPLRHKTIGTLLKGWQLFKVQYKRVLSNFERGGGFSHGPERAPDGKLSVPSSKVGYKRLVRVLSIFEGGRSPKCGWDGMGVTMAHYCITVCSKVYSLASTFTRSSKALRSSE